MLETILFALIAATYFSYVRQNGTERSCLAALAFVALYLIVYLGVPPHLPIKLTYPGQLFGLLPLLSLTLILFPQINRKMPISATKFLGWFMLLGGCGLLIFFKIFIW